MKDLPWLLTSTILNLLFLALGIYELLTEQYVVGIFTVVITVGGLWFNYLSLKIYRRRTIMQAYLKDKVAELEELLRDEGIKI